MLSAVDAIQLRVAAIVQTAPTAHRNEFAAHPLSHVAHHLHVLTSSEPPRWRMHMPFSLGMDCPNRAFSGPGAYVNCQNNGCRFRLISLAGTSHTRAARAASMIKRIADCSCLELGPGGEAYACRSAPEDTASPFS